MSKNKDVAELPDDIEVVGPGQMLAEAREKMGLTQQQVADKLNFRTTLVKNIEQEIFDNTLPDTFNRGYLKNYAKLVNVSASDVLASYEMINVAQRQGAEMQSFSKQTEKQAESNRIMWISYLILAILVGSTITWWFQDTNNSQDKVASPISTKTTDNVIGSKNSSSADSNSSSASDADDNIVSLSETLKNSTPTHNSQTGDKSADNSLEDNLAASQLVEQEDSNIVNSQSLDTPIQKSVSAPEAQVEFTFSGDCWVNIYDATGERIAWGIKKSGYVMNITGQAPFAITLGKPELVNINFGGKSVDMSQFSRGNIAKFTLPLSPNR